MFLDDDAKILAAQRKLMNRQCDTSRPKCKQCDVRAIECVYTTRDAEETRHMALRRENETLKSELRKLQDRIACLTATPENDALGHLRVHPTFSDSKQAFSSAAVVQQSIVSEERPSPRLTHEITSKVVSPQFAISKLQDELLLHHTAAYPKILAFESPQSIAKELLGPSGHQRLNRIAW